MTRICFTHDVPSEGGGPPRYARGYVTDVSSRIAGKFVRAGHAVVLAPNEDPPVKPRPASPAAPEPAAAADDAAKPARRFGRRKTR